MGIGEMARGLREAVAGFDCDLVSGEEAAALAEELALTEKACAALRARAGLRAAACGAQRSRGFAHAGEWMARVSGSSLGEAKGALEVAAATEACPATARALASGELSLAQAQVVVATVADCPGAEAEMLSLAQGSSMAALRHEARRRRLGAADAEELHRRQWAARQLRHWVDEEGMVRLVGALPPEVGVALANRLDAETDRIRRQARRQGCTESRAAHAADALVAITSDEATSKEATSEATLGAATSAPARRGRFSAEVVVVCDLRAYRRGHALPGEVCHVVGAGPLPVAVAREMARDAFVKAVVHDGVEIRTVAHLGRHIPAELRTALELGPLPGLDGVTCAVEGCGRRHHLEWDHVDPLAHGGRTSLDNLAPRCWEHHRAKTEADRAAGLLDPRAGPAP